MSNNIYNCSQLTVPITDPIHYVIVGNTALATNYALKLLATTGVDPNSIFILTWGNDLTKQSDLETLSYVAYNHTLKTLNHELIHLVLSTTANVNTNLTPTLQLTEQYFLYYTGSGPLGDSITAYYQPVVGPWFTYDSNHRLYPYVTSFTKTYP